MEAGFAAAEVVYEGEFETHRQQHVHLETHTAISYLTEDGRLHLRTSTQTPFLTKAKLAYLLGLFPDKVHVYTERVGGGFGAKQEMLCEESVRVCHIGFAPAGEMGVYAFRTVYRCHHTASLQDASETWREEGRAL